jgi:hypothetical protein
MNGAMQDQEPLFASPDETPHPKPIADYETPEGTHITASELSALPREAQLEVMRHWFNANYEDPAENCPYFSAEGGYQYIYGGPFDAEEELQNYFGGVVEDEVIAELAQKLSRNTPDWSGNSSNTDYLITT